MSLVVANVIPSDSSRCKLDAEQRVERYSSSVGVQAVVGFSRNGTNRVVPGTSNDRAYSDKIFTGIL
jgi:hypothetical protein